MRRWQRVGGTAAALASIVVVVLGLRADVNARETSAPSPASTLAATLQSDLDTYLHQRSAAEHLSALSLSVSFDSRRPAINIASGTTRDHGGSAATPASLFQIGSNTKAFTAVALLQLEAQHRLSIDAPLGTYLPQYPAYRKLTLRKLLNMTGGLESYDNTLSWNTPMPSTRQPTFPRTRSFGSSIRTSSFRQARSTFIRIPAICSRKR